MNIIKSLKVNQSGNVLFLILIAVVLFGALSYAVINSDRVNYKEIDDEKADLDQAVAENCEANINMAKMRLNVMNGCADDQLNYVLPSGQNDNPDAPSDGSCNIFYPGPGEATPCGSYENMLYANLGMNLDVDEVGGFTAIFIQGIPELEVGDLYKVTIVVSSFSSGDLAPYLGNSGSASALFKVNPDVSGDRVRLTSAGTHIGYVRFPNENKNLLIRNQNYGSQMTIDSVTLEHIGD